MIFTTVARGIYDVDSKYRVDIESHTCTCKGFFYNKKWCKHLQYFGGIKLEINNAEKETLLESLNFYLNCLKANNKQKESITEFKIKQLMQKINNL